LTGWRRRGTLFGLVGAWDGSVKMAGFVTRYGRIAGAALVFGLCIVTTSQPRAASIFEKNFWLSGPRYDRNVPACDYPGALDRIMANFHTKEIRFWNSELRIVGVENIQETAWMPWAAQSIPRRYCSGTAVINDGSRHPLYYSIAEDTGMIGMDYGVNFCVDGSDHNQSRTVDTRPTGSLDRNWAYNPDCRSAKP
jgi:hypothetical protein